MQPNVYGNLYQIYKNKESQNFQKKWENYEIKLEKNIIEKISQFKQIDQ